MSRVIGSFKDSVVLLRNNLLIVGIVFVVGLLTLPSSAARVLFSFSVRSMVAVGLFTFILFLITPFVSGGIYGMIKEALEGKTSNLETFKLEGKRNYFRLLIAYVIFFIILFAVTFGVGAFAAIVGVLATKGLGVSKPSPILVFFMMAIGMVLAFPLMYFFQFFDVGIVIDGYGSLKSFKESFRFVWNRKLSVLGFTVLLLIIMSPMMLPSFLLSITRSTGRPFFTPLPTNLAVLYIISTLALSTILGAVIYSYRAVYYIQAKGE